MNPFSCKCKKGFSGDGRLKCNRTCIDICVHGRCTNYPDYKCVCDLGWSGVDCSLDCGCNGHSTCKSGIGICDECQDYTEGLNCDKCMIGSYGNAKSPFGCRTCKCNLHGDEKKGQCNQQSGEVRVKISQRNSTEDFILVHLS